MKCTAYLSVLITLLPALVISKTIKRQNSGSFTLEAITNDADPILNYQPINARDNLFWIGYPTLTSCPDPPVTDCPPGNQTVLIATNDITVGISTSHEVPGEQKAYIVGPTEPNAGALSFNPAHSAVPSDAIIDQFDFNGSNLVYSEGSWWACPAFGAWYVQSATTNPNGQCIEIGIFTIPYTGPSPAAWEYD